MILFVTRKYPPSVGGMQKWSYELANRMAKIGEISTISWGRSQRLLPFFIAYALVRAAYLLATRPVRLIHVGDALLSPLGLILRCVSSMPVAVTVHGLDIVFPNRVYQWCIRRCLAQSDLVICVSEHTRTQCLDRGVSPHKCKVIGHGVDVTPFSSARGAEANHLAWAESAGLTGKRILLTVGRLVERKGIAHFVSSVLPSVAKACPDMHYLIVGEGPQADVIRRRVCQGGLQRFVTLLGRVQESTLVKIYEASHLFVMPNVPIEGDVEGFGMVALEASAAGLWVVASTVDGIPGAVRDGKNGTLIEPDDVASWVQVISSILADSNKAARLGRQARQYVGAAYSWDDVVAQYCGEFERLTGPRCKKTQEITDRTPNL